MEGVHESAALSTREVPVDAEGESAGIESAMENLKREFEELLPSVTPGSYDSATVAQAVDILHRLEAMEAEVRAKLPQH